MSSCRESSSVLLTLCLLTFVGHTLAQWDFPNNPQWGSDDRSGGVFLDEDDEEDIFTLNDRVRRQIGSSWRPTDNGVCPWYDWNTKPDCPPNAPFPGPCYEPPYYPYDEIEIMIPNIGKVIGRSMSYALDSYINIFLGIPYAKAPNHFDIEGQKRRFAKPQDVGPRWDIDEDNWCADRYRDACPQELWDLQGRFYEARNMSEDCMHLNIFRPNISGRTEEENRNYEVMVFVHGTDYKYGDAKLYPGNILARKEILVVTFNYRLGALGFLSTLDDASPGNYGLMDTIKVLQFVQDHIRAFGGNPDKVTLVGHDSGAAMIGLLMLSPEAWYKNKKLFHQAILMAGSDLCDWAKIRSVHNADASTYARDLGRAAGCGSDEYDLPTSQLVACLRVKSFEELVQAQGNVEKRYGSLAGPFGPVTDEEVVLTDPDPNSIYKIKIIAGVTKDEGAYWARNKSQDYGFDLDRGLEPQDFRELVYRMVQERSDIENVDEVVNAIEYEYTFWAKPENKTAIRQNWIDLWSDQVYGFCVDSVLKRHTECDDPTESCAYMYLFEHRSEYEDLPYYMGVPHRKDVDYLFGHPFFNESLGNLTGIIPDQWEWTYLDRNISEYVQDMWVNFTRYGTPTIQYTRNVSWWPFTTTNLSYIRITEFAYMDINYRQNHYAFWREFYPSLKTKDRLTTTPQPTPRPLINYQYATYSLTGAAVVALIVLVALGITLWRKSQ